MYNTHRLQLRHDSEKFKYKRRPFELEKPSDEGLNYELFIHTAGEILSKVENGTLLSAKDIVHYKQAAAAIELIGSAQMQHAHRTFLKILQQKNLIDKKEFKKAFTQLMENFRTDLGVAENK